MIKIYSLNDPITKEVRYIGKTNQQYLSSRLHSHMKDCKKSNSKKIIWIKSILINGLRPEINLLDEVEEENWEYWEKYYISYYKELGYDLVNTTSGGQRGYSIKGRKLSEEHKKKISIISRRPRVNKENFGIKKKIPIIQLTKDNVFIKEHLSALDANRETEIWKESIRNCCNNRSKSAGGFIWKYKYEKFK